jgi:hypothetical protein
MSRADEIRARADAEIAVAELEDQLLAAKAAGQDPPREVKDRLREARRVYRELTAGSGTANPDTVTATTEA